MRYSQSAPFITLLLFVLIVPFVMFGDKIRAAARNWHMGYVQRRQYRRMRASMPHRVRMLNQ